MDAIAPIGVVIATGMEDGQHLVRVASDEVGPCSATCVVLAEDDDMIE